MPHNWISSTAYSVDDLRDPEFTATHGTAPSIMDYARFNYIAQPGDGVVQLMPRVGEYDLWSIKWGYTYFPDMTEEQERERLQAMTLATRGDLALRYGAQTFDPVDPRSQSEDLGDDAVYASQMGLANLQRIVPRLQEWTTVEGEDYGDLDELYGQVVGQWARYLGHVGRQIGGVEIDPKMVGEEGVVYRPVAAERQRDAVAFLIEEGFSTPDWLLDPEILGRIEPAGSTTRIQGLQEGALNRILDPVRLGRLAEAEWLASDAYPAAEMMDDLQAGLFAEIANGRSIDVARRSLQRAYVARLGELLTSEASIPAAFANRAYGYSPQSTDRSEVRPLARGALLTLQTAIGRALPRYAAQSERAERYHLLDLQARIEDILDPND